MRKFTEIFHLLHGINIFNVVAMELSGTSGELGLLSDNLLSRFYGRNYTWIGAVILTNTLNEVGENKKMTRYRIIKHPYAEKPLPEEFFEITKKIEGAKN